LKEKTLRDKKTLKNKKELQEIIGVVFENPTNHIKEWVWCNLKVQMTLKKGEH